MTNVVVVESPAKAKTIEKYLGKDFKVLASYGHVRDLLEKDGAVDPEHGYLMKYAVAEEKEKHIAAIASALKKADTLYLATDPDREGEAISWHLQEILGERGLLKGRKVFRVVFYEITEREVREAIQQPRAVSMDLVNAYRTRRAMDHLIGFKLSPLLWRKISPKLSAGRVQSPALRLLVEREEAIEAFRSQEYWSIEAITGTPPSAFAARLVEYAGRKVVDTFNREKPEIFTFQNASQATEAQKSLETAAGGQLRVKSVERSQRRRRAAPPFITSTLQQEGSRKLGFRARNTMQIAQKLYEGITIPEGTVGLITYMRTDSVGLAKEAVDDIRNLIVERYGKASLPAEPNVYKTSAKNAQEAHEGIRPTSIRRIPEDLRGHLTDEQFKLYSLIWKRTIASQMEPAVYDMLAVDLVPSVRAETGRFRATGSTLVSPGFIAVYLEGRDEGGDDDTDVKLPAVQQGDLLPAAPSATALFEAMQALRERYQLLETDIVYVQEVESKPIRAIYMSQVEPRLIVVDKESGGSKADAVNAALNIASSPYVCVVDADSILEPDALLRIMVPIFADPTRVIAAGGALGGFGRWPQLKAERLRAEGVTVVERRVRGFAALRWAGTRPR